MEQWQADIAVHCARTEKYPHQAIAKAEALIQAIADGVRQAEELAVKQARNRWDYQRRRVSEETR